MLVGATMSMIRRGVRQSMRTIDLFAGAGGLTEGFRMAGFKTVFANDFEEPAAETLARNHPNARVSSQSVQELDAEELRRDLGLQKGELDAVIGGPPCQGFSTYGRRDLGDARNQLYLNYLEFVDAFRPKAIVIENVVGILSIDQGAVVEDIRERLMKLGYAADVFVLDARAYGVPQSRKRVFILGAANDQRIAPPIATHHEEPQAVGQGMLFEASLPNPLTVRDAISDLPETALKPKETHDDIDYSSPASTPFQKLMRSGSERLHHHSAKQMLGIRRLRLALMHPGDYGTRIEERLANGGLPADLVNRLLGGTESLRDIDEVRTVDREKERLLREMLTSGHTTLDNIREFVDSQGFANKYRRLHWERPSHTLVAHMARDCSDFVHPSIDRFITVREAARLQSFPDRYYFTGSQFHQLRQIGNAVPPLLAQAVGSAVARAIS